jgi:hypothetical protein
MKFASSTSNPPKQKASSNASRPAFKPATPLPPGPHPGFSKLKSQSDVFRNKLRPAVSKRNPDHGDYEGVIFLDGGRKAGVRLWVHADGTLGLRLELLTRKGGVPPCR